MAGPVKARRLSEDEGRRLQQIVRRVTYGSIRMRSTMMIMASGAPVPAIARLVTADENTVRKVFHDFNDRGRPAWTLRGREATVPA